MKKEDIYPGDILVYKHSDAWSSKLIAYLTDSQISHAALILENQSIVEMDRVSDGITWYDFSIDEKLPGHSYVHVMRHQDVTAFEPVFSIVQEYMDKKIKFDTPLEIMIGLLLAFRKIPITKKLYEVLKPYLIKLIKIIDDAIASLAPDGARPMVCSEMIYYSFWQCQDPYPIRITNGFLQNKSLPEIGSVARPPIDESILFTEAMGERLYEACFYHGNDAIEMADEQKMAELQALKSYFCARVNEYTTKSDIPIEALTTMPVDFLCNAENLKKIGETDIYYE